MLPVLLLSATISAHPYRLSVRSLDFRADCQEPAWDLRQQLSFSHSFPAHECLARKCSRSAGMSSFRSRRGGKRRVTPFIRKYSSRRKRPPSTSFSKSRDVEEINRNAVLPLRPFGSPSGSNESNTF